MFQFDQFQLDPADRTLRRDGDIVPLPSKVFDTLLLLVQRRGKLATKDYLMKELWPDSFVEEANLSQNISVLRKALGESAQRPGYIVTVAGHGYRFVADVREAGAAEPPASAVTGSRLWAVAASLLAAAVVVLTVAAAWSRTSRGAGRYLDLTRATTTRITESGNATGAAMTADGRYVAYVQNDGDEYSIWIRNLTTGGVLPLVPRGSTPLMYLSFSPGGDHLYFARQIDSGFALHRISTTGGDDTPVLRDVDTPASFSPDGSQFAFMRGTDTGGYQIVIAQTHGGGERILASKRTPEMFAFLGPAWSPDGQTVAAVSARAGDDPRWSIELLAVSNGSSREIFSSQHQIGRVRWLPDGSGLLTIVSEALSRQNPPWQAGTLAHISGGALWRVEYPGGQADRLTPDLTDYDICCLEVTADGRRVSGIQNTLVSDLWIAHAGRLDAPKQITRSAPVFKRHDWLPDNDTIVYRDLNGSLHAVDKDGRAVNVSLPEGQKVVSGVSVCGDGRYAVVQTAPGHSVWRVSLGSAAASQLTSGHIDAYPACSPDGRWVVYPSVRADTPSIWRVPVEGGEPTPMIEQQSLEALPSPGGRLLYYLGVEWDERPVRTRHLRWIVVSAVNGARVFSRDMPTASRLGVSPVWAPDESGLDYIFTRDGVSNIWRQPIAGGPAVPLTHFVSGKIFSFAWSRDGQWLSFGGGANRSDVVLMTGSR